MGLLRDHVVIVTGGAQGIGLAVSARALEEGACVVVADSNGEAVRGMQRSHPERTVAVTADLREPEQCAGVVDAAVSSFGRLTALVNNAGVIRRTSTEETTIAMWNDVISVNLTAAFLMTRAAIPELAASSNGRIVNVSSRAAKRPHRSASPAYGASKAGLLYLTKHWAVELANAGIRVNAVCPGPVDTEMFHQMGIGQRARIAREIPRGEVGSVDEIANVIVFLLSDMSSYVNGESMHANGGSYME